MKVIECHELKLKMCLGKFDSPLLEQLILSRFPAIVQTARKAELHPLKEPFTSLLLNQRM